MQLCVRLLHLVCEVRVVLLCSVSCIPSSSLHLAMANSSETDDIGCDVEVWTKRQIPTVQHSGTDPWVVISLCSSPIFDVKKYTYDFLCNYPHILFLIYFAGGILGPGSRTAEDLTITYPISRIAY